LVATSSGFPSTSLPFPNRWKKYLFKADIRTGKTHFLGLEIEIRCLENFDLLLATFRMPMIET
jgi:hypothetical protein